MRLQTAFHPIPPSERLIGKVRKRATELQASHDDIVGCHVSVSAPDHEEANLTDTGRWKVALLLTIRSGNMTRRGPRAYSEDRDVYEALDSAFEGAQERLSSVG